MSHNLFNPNNYRHLDYFAIYFAIEKTRIFMSKEKKEKKLSINSATSGIDKHLQSSINSVTLGIDNHLQSSINSAILGIDNYLQISFQTATLGINNNLGIISGLAGDIYTQHAYLPELSNEYGLSNNVVLQGGHNISKLCGDANSEQFMGKYSPYKIDPNTISTKAIFEIGDNYNSLQGINTYSNLQIKDGIVEVASMAFIQPKSDSIDYLKNTIENSNILNGCFTVEPSNIVDSFSVNKNGFQSSDVFIRDGILSENPTHRLMSGSIECLRLTSNNNLSLNSVIIEQANVLPSILGITRTTQDVLAGIEWNKIGTSYNLNMLDQLKIKDNFLEISSRYLDLYKPPEGSLMSYSIPEPLRELTSLEYLNNSFLLRSTYEHVKKAETESISDKLKINEVLVRHLTGLKPDLMNLYHGALETLNSANPDRIRHYTTSLRELFTHVLHQLAPDNQIKNWTNDTSFYDKGKPTRKARLSYIARKFDNNKFKKFVECDIKATIEFIDLFNEGTHSMVSSTSESQLAIMKAKMEDTLVYLIEASKIN
jgi:hypothetical protein